MNWDYQVIRLNVEPPVAQAPAPATEASDQPGEASAPASSAVFSEAYLKEEFPRFYNPSDQPQQPVAQVQEIDPAVQLQEFLNTQGRQGWELVGFQHAQPHVFIVFKRPAAEQETPFAAQVAAQSEQLRLTLDLANRALSIIEKQAG
jgi:hypothetical protein